MLQRLALAQALVGKPRLLFLDEPTSGVDPHGVLLVRRLLAGLKAAGVTILFNSHQLDQVERVSDRVLFLRERLSNPIRVAALFGLALFPIPIALVDRRPNSSVSFFRPLLAVTLASGILGLDISSGVLALVFTRPVARRVYALSKWASVTATAAVLSAAQLLAVLLMLRVRHGSFDGEALGPRLAERVLAAAGTSAVLLLVLERREITYAEVRV